MFASNATDYFLIVKPYGCGVMRGRFCLQAGLRPLRLSWSAEIICSGNWRGCDLRTIRVELMKGSANNPANHMAALSHVESQPARPFGSAARVQSVCKAAPGPGPATMVVGQVVMAWPTAKVVQHYEIALSPGLHLPFRTMSWLSAMMFLVQHVPATILGLGVREGAPVLRLTTCKGAPAEATSFSLILSGYILAKGQLGGLFEFNEQFVIR